VTDDEFEELKKKAAATRQKRWRALYRSDWRERLRVWEAQYRGTRDRETDGDKIAFDVPGPWYVWHLSRIKKFFGLK
jgi:capsid protein